MARYSFDDGRHVHTLDGKPLMGCTTALSIISKPLTWWASGQAVGTLGWINPKENKVDACNKAAEEKLAAIKGMSLAEYRALLNTAYRAHNARKEKAADAGIDRHALIEAYIKAQIAGNHQKQPNPAEIQPFAEWAKTNVKQFLFSEVCCYSETLWTGGIADFGFLDMAGDVVLGDIKSSKTAYASQFYQLGGYQLMIEENGGYSKSGEKVFTLPKPIKYHQIFSFGADLGKPFTNRLTAEARRAFAYAVNLYRENMFFEEAMKK